MLQLRWWQTHKCFILPPNEQSQSWQRFFKVQGTTWIAKRYWSRTFLRCKHTNDKNIFFRSRYRFQVYLELRYCINSSALDTDIERMHVILKTFQCIFFKRWVTATSTSQTFKLIFFTACKFTRVQNHLGKVDSASINNRGGVTHICIQ